MRAKGNIGDGDAGFDKFALQMIVKGVHISQLEKSAANTALIGDDEYIQPGIGKKL